MTDKKKLLLVDDDVDLLQALSIKLNKSDRFEVMTTSEGQKAVALATEFLPDLIVLDIEMPGMDGGEVAAALEACAETRHIPVLFLSSLVAKADVARSGGKSGGRNIASKSMTVRDLVQRITDLIDGKPED